jgi:hypothetical protein
MNGAGPQCPLACARVGHAWREPHTFLGPHVPRQRRAFYAPYVRCLHVDELEELQLDNWTFPNLRTLSIMFKPAGYTATTTRTVVDALARSGPQLAAFRFSVAGNLIGMGYRRDLALLPGAPRRPFAAVHRII